jgi:hypothetical protein
MEKIFETQMTNAAIYETPTVRTMCEAYQPKEEDRQKQQEVLSKRSRRGSKRKQLIKKTRKGKK